MKRLFVLLGLLVLLVAPTTSQALELGAGISRVTFTQDVDLDSDFGAVIDITFGGGMSRLMFSLVDAEPEGIDYDALMGGVAFVLDVGFDFRVFALLSQHNLDGTLVDIEGTGVTLGGAFGFPVFPTAEVVGDIRLSQWDDSGFEVGTGMISLLFRIEL